MAAEPIIVIFSLFAGILISLLPGLHPNSVGAILSPWLGENNAWSIVLVILLGVRLPLQFLPSILVSTPAGQTGIGMLPGARMMREGRGMEAIAICAWAVVLGVGISLLIIPFALPMLPALFAAIKPYVGYLLLAAASALIFSEGGEKSYYALFVFLLAGALGWLALNLPMSDPLFCLFVGFFTMPALLLGEGKIEAVEQQMKPKSKAKKSCKNCWLDFGIPNISFMIFPFILLGVILGGLADLLPGMSTPAQIATLATLAVPMRAAEQFLALIASIEASHTAFAFASAASSGVARIGVVAMIEQQSPISAAQLPTLLGAFSLSVAIGAGALVLIGRWIMPRWHIINWDALGILLALYLLIMVFLLDGVLGLLVFGIATAIGTLAWKFEIKRTHVMGSLILPAIIYSLL